MTKLEAVNEMLEALGEPPATALDTGGTSEVAQAETILDREHERLLRRGWAANTILEREYTPDGSDQIVLDPATVLSIRPVLSGYGNQPRSTDTEKRVAIRDGKLYDLINDQNTFDDPLYLEVVELVALDELPGKLATYIVKLASVKFQRFLKRGKVDDAFARDEMMQAKVEAEQEDQDLRATNVLKTPEARRIMGNRYKYPTGHS